MKKSKFDKIIEDLLKSTQDILDNANDLMQDKKIAEVGCYSLTCLIKNSLDIKDNIADIKRYAEKNDDVAEAVYNFDKCKFTFDDEGDD